MVTWFYLNNFCIKKVSVLEAAQSIFIRNGCYKALSELASLKPGPLEPVLFSTASLDKLNSISLGGPTSIWAKVHLTVFHAQRMAPLQIRSSVLEVLFYSLMPKSFCFPPWQQALSNISLCKWFLFSSFPWPTPSLPWPLTNTFLIFLGLIFLSIKLCWLWFNDYTFTFINMNISLNMHEQRLDSGRKIFTKISQLFLSLATMQKRNFMVIIFELRYAITSGSQCVVHEPAALTLHESLLETQILRLALKPSESVTLRWGPAICVLTSCPGDFTAHHSLRIAIN